MDQIRKQARIARRRMISQRFMAYLPWTLSLALVAAVAAISLPKLMYLPVDNVIWFASWMGGTVALAVIVNIVLTVIGRPTLADAAVEIDHRFGLRERLSSALVLSKEDRETELGQALAADARPERIGHAPLRAAEGRYAHHQPTGRSYRQSLRCV